MALQNSESAEKKSRTQPQEESDCCALLPKSFTPHPLGYEPNPKPVNTDSKLAKENIDSKLTKQNADSKLAKQNSKLNSDPPRKLGTDSKTNLKPDVKFDASSIKSLNCIADNIGGQVAGEVDEKCFLKTVLDKKKTTSEYVPKPLPQRMGSWMTYLAGIRSKDKCFDSRGRTSLRIPCISLLDGTIIRGREHAPTLNQLAAYLTKHKDYEALTWEEAALTRSRRVLFQHEILGIQEKHVSPQVMKKIREDLEISKEWARRRFGPSSTYLRRRTRANSSSDAGTPTSQQGIMLMDESEAAMKVSRPLNLAFNENPNSERMSTKDVFGRFSMVDKEQQLYSLLQRNLHTRIKQREPKRNCHAYANEDLALLRQPRVSPFFVCNRKRKSLDAQPSSQLAGCSFSPTILRESSDPEYTKRRRISSAPAFHPTTQGPELAQVTVPRTSSRANIPDYPSGPRWRQRFADYQPAPTAYRKPSLMQSVGQWHGRYASATAFSTARGRRHFAAVTTQPQYHPSVPRHLLRDLSHDTMLDICPVDDVAWRPSLPRFNVTYAC